MQLILAWQNAQNRKWYPVARVGYDEQSKEYWLRYTEGINHPEVQQDAYVPGMANIAYEYRSGTLFAFLQNRVYNKQRADFHSYLRWLGTTESTIDPLYELAITGGHKVTDRYCLYPVPEPQNNMYYVSFHIHGQRYMSLSRGIFEKLAEGSRLYLQHDLQNTDDSLALSIRSENPTAILGYVPRLMNEDVHELMKLNGPENVHARLEAKNSTPMLPVRLRCSVTCPWPAGFSPYNKHEFTAVETSLLAAVVA